MLLQPGVLQQLHCAHKGKLRAKESVFWAKNNKDIDDMVKSCPPCQHHQKSNAKELPHDVPQKAWYTLFSYIFFWSKTDDLLVADSYSTFSVLKKLVNTQSPIVIAHLKCIFEEHGIPSRLVTDNGSRCVLGVRICCLPRVQPWLWLHACDIKPALPSIQWPN